MLSRPIALVVASAAAFAVAALLLLLVYPPATSPHRPTGSPTPTPTASPTPTPTAAAAGIDTLPAANTCSTIGGGSAGIDAGDVTSVLNNVTLNSQFSIDIVVDSVPAPGTSGLGLDFGFNDSIMKVNGSIANAAIPSLFPAGPIYLCNPTVIPFGPVTDSVPDTVSPFALTAVT